MKPCLLSGLAGVLVLAFAGPSVAAEKLVFEEALNDGNTDDAGYRGAIQTNVVVPGTTGGWQVSAQNSQIRYDIDKKGEYPNGLQCGSVEVDFRALDPENDFNGLANCGSLDGGPGTAECYVNFVGVYDGIHGDFHKSQSNAESFLLVHAMHEKDPQAAWRNSRLKFMSGSWSPSGSGIMNLYLPPMNKDDQDWASLTDSVYTATVSFKCAGVAYALARKDPGGGGKSWTGNGPWSWNGDPGDHQPNYKYVFIGSDNANGFWIDGVIFQRVKVSEETACDCPAPDTSDAGAGDAGSDAASHDSGPSDAALESSTPDAAAAMDAGHGGTTPTEDSGCSCRTAGERTDTRGLVVALGVVIALTRRRRQARCPVSGSSGGAAMRPARTSASASSRARAPAARAERKSSS